MTGNNKVNPIAFALVLALHVIHVYGETYFNNYQIFKPTAYSIVTSESACISTCLSSLTCSAVSLCYTSASKLFCTSTSCGNIRLLATTDEACKTIVFSDAVVGSSYLQADYEWILTDVCGGSSYPNTGLSDTSTVSLQQVSGSTAAQSTFFGNSYSLSDANLTASSVYINVSKSFTLLYWFQLYTTVPTISFVLIKFGIEPNMRSLSVTYANQIFYFSTDLTGTVQAFTSNSIVALELNKWHSFVVVYNPTNPAVKVYLDSAVVLSGTIGVPSSLQLLRATISVGWLRNGALISGTLYCVKLYSSALQQADVLTAGNSCLKGEVNLMTTLPQPQTSINAYSLVASTTYNNIRILMYYCSTSCPILTTSRASQFCQSVGYEAAQLADPKVFYAFTQFMRNVNTYWQNPVVGALYDSTSNSYKWSASGLPLSYSLCPTISSPISNNPIITFYSSYNCFQNYASGPHVLGHFACTSQ